jgi:hypothetical protein
MADKKEIQFSIHEFEIGNFSNTVPKESVRKDRLDYKIQHQFDFDVEKKLFTVGFKIKVTASPQSNVELANIETFTFYKLKGVEDDEINRLPDHLVITFLSIAYSNTRGALAAKAQGTVVGEVPLPLINPTQVIEEMKKRANEGK